MTDRRSLVPSVARALAAAVALALASPAPSFAALPKAAKPVAPAHAAASPAPTATPAPSPLERARSAYDAIVAGAYDRADLSPALAGELPQARLDAYAAVLRPLGAPAAFENVGTHDLAGVTTYDFVVRYAAGNVVFTYGIEDATARVAKLFVHTAR